jgi:cell division protein FtsW
MKYKWWMVIIGFIVLILVFIPGIGIENYGAKRWIGLPGFTIQASEIAKFCFIVFAGAYMCQHYDKVKSLKGILPVITTGGGMCVLILLEPNMSITICLGLVMLIMLFVGGIRTRHFMMLLIPALCLIPILILIEPYRMSRLVAFINPWANPKGEGYQLIQSLYSLGAGGWFGVGLFNSRQKYLFLPFSESDFIFSIIAEELGLFGAIALLGIFVSLIICGYKIAINSKNRFGCYLATGITSLIAVQVLVNIAVVTGSIPPTGLPLPFISAGSSSIIVLMTSIGILFNINKQNSSREVIIERKYQKFRLGKRKT